MQRTWMACIFATVVFAGCTTNVNSVGTNSQKLDGEAIVFSQEAYEDHLEHIPRVTDDRVSMSVTRVTPYCSPYSSIWGNEGLGYLLLVRFKNQSALTVELPILERRFSEDALWWMDTFHLEKWETEQWREELRSQPTLSYEHMKTVGIAKIQPNQTRELKLFIPIPNVNASSSKCRLALSSYMKVPIDDDGQGDRIDEYAKYEWISQAFTTRQGDDQLAGRFERAKEDHKERYQETLNSFHWKTNIVDSKLFLKEFLTDVVSTIGNTKPFPPFTGEIPTYAMTGDSSTISFGLRSDKADDSGVGYPLYSIMMDFNSKTCDRKWLKNRGNLSIKVTLEQDGLIWKKNRMVEITIVDAKNTDPGKRGFRLSIQHFPKKRNRLPTEKECRQLAHKLVDRIASHFK